MNSVQIWIGTLSNHKIKANNCNLLKKILPMSNKIFREIQFGCFPEFSPILYFWQGRIYIEPQLCWSAPQTTIFQLQLLVAASFTGILLMEMWHSDRTSILLLQLLALLLGFCWDKCHNLWHSGSFWICGSGCVNTRKLVLVRTEKVTILESCV